MTYFVREIGLKGGGSPFRVRVNRVASVPRVSGRGGAVGISNLNTAFFYRLASLAHTRELALQGDEQHLCE